MQAVRRCRRCGVAGGERAPGAARLVFLTYKALFWVTFRPTLSNNMLKLKKIKNRTFKADFGITLNKAEIVKSLNYSSLGKFICLT